MLSPELQSRIAHPPRNDPQHQISKAAYFFRRALTIVRRHERVKDRRDKIFKAIFHQDREVIERVIENDFAKMIVSQW